MSIIAIQQYSVENQKGAITVQSPWRKRPSGCQRNIIEQRYHPFGSKPTIYKLLHKN